MSSANPEVLAVGDPRLDEKARTIFILIGIFFPLTVIAMVFRLYARTKKRLSFELNDFFAVVAFVIWICWISVAIWAGKNGGGWSLVQLPLVYQNRQLRAFIVGPIFTASMMTAAKLSILTLYLKLFQPSRSFRIQFWIVTALCVLWWLGAVFATVFQCAPIRAAWDIMLQIQPSTKCANVPLFIVGIEVPNGVLDFVVAGMALHVVHGLHMKPIHKVGLAVMFLLCTLVAVIGFLRIAMTYRPATYSFWDQWVWLAVQNAFVIICCCLPTYGVFLTKLGNPFDSVAGFFRSLTARSRSSSYQETRSNASRENQGQDDRSFEMGPTKHSGSSATATATVKGDAGSSITSSEPPFGVIEVKSTVDQKFHAV